MTETTPAAPSTGISGSTLKIIAIVTMLFDHIGAGLLEPAIMNAARAAGMTTWIYGQLFSACPNLMIPYAVFRLAGRIAFPIFCFLLVEGFLHTRNLKLYAARLGAFALISEIPFDLAFHNQLFYRDYQNVFFTLFLGLITIACLQYLDQNLAGKQFLRSIGRLIVLILGMLFAFLLKTDYSYMGVLTIAVIYELRRNKVLAITGSCVCLILMSFLEITSVIAIPLVKAYNGTRGLKLKYFFYAFYPVHLFLLYLIRQVL